MEVGQDAHGVKGMALAWTVEQTPTAQALSPPAVPHEKHPSPAARGFTEAVRTASAGYACPCVTDNRARSPVISHHAARTASRAVLWLLGCCRGRGGLLGNGPMPIGCRPRVLPPVAKRPDDLTAARCNEQNRLSSFAMAPPLTTAWSYLTATPSTEPHSAARKRAPQATYILCVGEINAARQCDGADCPAHLTVIT